MKSYCVPSTLLSALYLLTYLLLWTFEIDVIIVINFKKKETEAQEI